MSHFSGHFEGASTFLTPKLILPPKKNYIPQFLKQRDINSYIGSSSNKQTDQEMRGGIGEGRIKDGEIGEGGLKRFVLTQPVKHLDFTMPPAVALLN